jgi:hypothetical protein
MTYLLSQLDDLIASQAWLINHGQQRHLGHACIVAFLQQHQIDIHLFRREMSIAHEDHEYTIRIYLIQFQGVLKNLHKTTSWEEEALLRVQEKNKKTSNSIYPTTFKGFVEEPQLVSSAEIFAYLQGAYPHYWDTFDLFPKLEEVFQSQISQEELKSATPRAKLEPLPKRL